MLNPREYDEIINRKNEVRIAPKKTYTKHDNDAISENELRYLNARRKGPRSER